MSEASQSLFIIFVGLIGLCFGSFANVIVWRWPENWSVIWPPSHCPKCMSPIRAYENIPVVSWFYLRGKCSSCGTAISWRYPLVELLTGLLFAGVALRYGNSFSTFELCYLMFALVIVSCVDFDRMILPDLFTVSGCVLGLIGSLFNPNRNLADSITGLFLGGFILWSIAYVYAFVRNEEGMGGGDVKLLAWIGSVLGWKAVIFVLLGSSLLGSVVGVAVALRTKGGLKTRIPFGPYLAFAGAIYALAGEQLIQWYLSLFLLEPVVR